jgi:beta-1,4-mannosyl-glycoprotein beta-1,4-N-acetylglucosaminyltransferase
MKYKIIDAFIFFQELDLLEIRLSYLYPYVDLFIIVEACQTFTAKTK